jgi:microsomal epoxide hydrolase
MLRAVVCLCLLVLIARSSGGGGQAQTATFRTTDGVLLHYFNAGSGAAIILIPGWTMAADIFAPQINGLSKRFRVIALDVRSQGDSEKTTEGNTLERHAQDIQELIDQLHLQEVVLLGWSNGVPDVLTFIEQHGSSTLRGVVLVDGFLNASEPQLRQAINSMLKRFQADRAKFTDGFVRSMYNKKPSEAYIRHVEQQSLKTPTNTAVVEMFNVLNKGDLTPVLAKLDKPVLYICEPQLEWQGKALKAVMPKAQVAVFKNAGHALFVDESEHFNQVLARFVDSLPPK